MVGLPSVEAPAADSAASVSRVGMVRKIDLLGTRLRRRQIKGSQVVALEVVKLFREIVAAAKYATFEALLQHIEAVGKTLQDCGPKELVVTNITRRVLKFLTEEYQTALSAFLLASTSHSSTSSIPSTPHTPGWGLSGLETPGTFFPERGDPFAFTSRVDGAGEGKFRGIGGSMFDLLGHKGDSTSAQGAGDKFSAGKDHLWSAQNSPGLSAPNSPSKLFSTLPSSFDKPALSRIATSTSGQLSPHVTTMLEEDFSKKAHNLKPVFIEAIQELIDEVEMTQRSVGEQSLDHIHSGEFILTVGKSRTVEAFLKNASRKRKFTVIVAETAPSFSGRDMALALSSAGISTILIPDSNIFSLLPRCSKILLSPHLVFADGTLHSISGSLPICLAAKKMRVPVVVVGGMFKFSPLYCGGDAEWGLRDLGSPMEVLDESAGEGVEVLNPRFDVVPAHLVDLYITNLGGHPRSLLYRLLSDQF